MRHARRQFALSLAVLAIAAGSACAQSIITVNELLLDPASVTPTQIGGTIAGQEHDKYLVLGPARLDGRLDLVLIDNYTPQPGDTLELVEAQSLTGDFRSHFFPEPLPAGVAVQFFETSNRYFAQFAAPSQATQFVGQDAIAGWFNTSNWSQGEPPTSIDAIDLINVTPSEPQTVVVSGGTTGQLPGAKTQAINVVGGSIPLETMTLRIAQSGVLSASERATVGPRGRIEVDGSQLVTSLVEAHAGGLVDLDAGQLIVGRDGVRVDGLLAGTGDIRGDLRPQAGTVRVGGLAGGELGTLKVDGRYTQSRTATLELDLFDLATGAADRLEITGDALLGGELRIDLADQGGLNSGDQIDLVIADDVLANSRFDRVALLGAGVALPPSLYGGPKYTETTMAIGFSAKGDMDLDFDIDDDDIDLFALALRDRDAYFDWEDEFGPLGIDGDISGDVDADGDLDFDDIDDFVGLFPAEASSYVMSRLLGAPVPEPTGAAIGLALAALFTIRRREP